MTTYRITAPHFVAAIITDEGVVTQSAPILGWCVNKEFTFVRDYCHQRGWIVEPLGEIEHPRWLEYNGLAYEIHWRNNAIVRITVHDGDEERDVCFDELPETLKRLV